MPIIAYLFTHILLFIPNLIRKSAFLPGNTLLIGPRIAQQFFSQINVDLGVFVGLVVLLLVLFRFVFKSEHVLKETYRTSTKVLWPLIFLKLLGFSIFYYYGYKYWLWHFPINARQFLLVSGKVSFERMLIKIILDYTLSFLFLLFLLKQTWNKKKTNNMKSSSHLFSNLRFRYVFVLFVPLLLFFVVAEKDAITMALKHRPHTVEDPFPKGKLPFLFADKAKNSSKDYDFQQFKDRVVVVDFWASWCWPCRQELPILKQLRAEFSEEDVVFIGVNREPNNISGAQKAWLKHEMNFESLLDHHAMRRTGLGETLGFESLPTLYILNQKSEISHIHIGLTPKEILRSDIEFLLQ